MSATDGVSNDFVYDRIGHGYAALRRPDPRIAAAIWQALADAETVLNVGAGAGSYEPTDRSVVALEPSLTMIRQRGESSVPVVRASATHLPFPDRSFDAVLAVLTIHHWHDRAGGLLELARVARSRVVIFTCDPSMGGFWLVQDYFPEIREIDRRILPTVDELKSILGDIEVRSVLIPWNCTDGFLGAYWRRPYAYLSLRVRSAISTFSKISDVEAGIRRLRRDLEDGTWSQRYGYLLNRDELDLGYRLVIRSYG